MKRNVLKLLRRAKHGTDNAPAPQVDSIQHVVTNKPVLAGPAVEEAAEQRAEPTATTPTSPAAAASRASTADVSEDLWSRAYQAVQDREPELVKDYEKHVKNGDGGAGGLSDPESVTALVKSLQDSREKAQWKFSVRSKDVKVSDQLEKLVKLLALADGVVKQALSSRPYAALAWSTVSVFIPLLSDGFAKHMAMVKGFTTIAELQVYWRSYEIALLKSTSSDHYKNLATPLANVYSSMLEYQMRAVCHLSKRQLSRAWQSVTGNSDWGSKEADIIKISDRCVANIAPLQHEKMAQSLAAQNVNLARISDTEENILRAIKDHSQKDTDNRQKDARNDFLQALKSTADDYRGGMEFNSDSVKGTCEWFFADESFSAWRDSPDSGVFWLTAGPGCGKSVLARTLVKDGHLNNTTTTVNTASSTVTNSVAVVCYFFFKDDDFQRARATTALSSLLHQLFSHESTNHLIEYVLPAFERSGQSLTGSLEDLWSTLVTCAEKLTHCDLICVLDALDECNGEDRRQLIRRLDGFYGEDRAASKTNLKFLITSRPYHEIEMCFRPLSKRAEYFQFDADERHEEISHDIDLVIDAETDSFAVNFSDADRQKIAKSLKSKGTKTYLWLHLALRIMKADPSQYSRRRDVDALLAEVPAEVSEAYEKILNRAKNEKTTGLLLQILLAAARPLALDEANYALTLALEEDGYETHDELKEDCWKTGFKTIVKNFSGLLISVYSGKLRFIHLTAQEYLTQKTDSASPSNRWGGRFADSGAANAVMSRCCMQYLLLWEFTPPFDACLSQNPLLDYAATYWPRHFEAQSGPSKRCWMQKARLLCETSENPLNVWGCVYGIMVEPKIPFPSWGTELVVAAHVGLSTVVDELLKDQATDINEVAVNYGTALHASIAAKNDGIAEALISKGADVNAVSPTMGTPLYWASNRKDMHMTSLLLSHGASPLVEFPPPKTNFQRNSPATTALGEAANEEDMGIFCTLASAVVDISTPDRVLDALTQEPIIRCGRKCLALLSSLLPDDKLGGGNVLDNLDILKGLLELKCTRERVLRLLAKENRQQALLEEPVLPLALKWPSSRDAVQIVLERLDVPCASISRNVLKGFVQIGDPKSLETLLRYRPEGTCEPKDLLLSASLSCSNNTEMVEFIVDVAGQSLVDDKQLQNEALESLKRCEAIEVFFKLPKYTVQVARRVIRNLLSRMNPLRSHAGGERDMINRVLGHCTDKDDVIDTDLIMDMGRSYYRETIQWLFSLGNDRSVSKETLLAAAAQNRFYGRSIIAAALQSDEYVAAISPNVVWIATAVGNAEVLDLLLERFPSKVDITAELVLAADCEFAFTTLMKWREDEVIKVGPRALQIAMDNECHGAGPMKKLIPYCTSSLTGKTEDVILMLLEGEITEVEANLKSLINANDNGIVLTERILATAGRHHRLLDRIRAWRPKHITVTPSLIALVAAGGNSKSLDSLAKCGNGLSIGEAWYRLARFRFMLHQGSRCRLDRLVALWGEGPIVDAADVDGDTALHLASMSKKDPLITKFLLDVAAVPSVDAVNREGRTALHYAVQSDSYDTVQLLLAAGADPHKPDRRGRTPITMATEQDAQFCKACKLRGNRSQSLRPNRYKILEALNGNKEISGSSDHSLAN